MQPNQTHNTWTVQPPTGCRFANMIGGEVILIFPRGQEKAVHDHVIREVHKAYLASLQAPAPPPPPPPAPVVLGVPPLPQPPPPPAEGPTNYAQAIAEAIPAVVSPQPIAQAPAETDAEIVALLSGADAAADTVPPPAMTQCQTIYEIDHEHDVQCTLAPNHKGMHCVKVGEIYYPMNLVPKDVWRKKSDA